MEFKVGQDIVYPKYGLGKILAIKHKKLPRGRTKGVLIRFPAMHMTVWVPDVLRNRARFRLGTKAKERAQFYKNKVLSGDPVDLAETVRDLVRLSIKKSLNVREAEIANTAMRTLVRELALATGKTVDAVREDLDDILYR
jgi:CarD family transcriptional regulator